MGVDWLTCGICGENYPDCGPCGYCSGCETSLCGGCHEEQIDKYGHPDPESEAALLYGEWSAVKCDLCSGEIIQDHHIIDFLLKKTGMTIDDVKGEIKGI